MEIKVFLKHSFSYHKHSNSHTTMVVACLNSAAYKTSDNILGYIASVMIVGALN